VYVVEFLCVLCERQLSALRSIARKKNLFGALCVACY